MAGQPLVLYYDMTEKLSDHLRTKRAYPEKFVLSPLLHADYLRDVALLSQSLEKDIDPTMHMGVPVEISDTTVGVMVACDGVEIWLL